MRNIHVSYSSPDPPREVFWILHESSEDIKQYLMVQAYSNIEVSQSEDQLEVWRFHLRKTESVKIFLLSWDQSWNYHTSASTQDDLQKERKVGDKEFRWYGNGKRKKLWVVIGIFKYSKQVQAERRYRVIVMREQLSFIGRITNRRNKSNYKEERN